MADARNTLSRQELQEYRDFALKLASEARAIVKAALVGGFSVKHKPDGSYLTSVDLKVEEHLRALIGSRYPDHGVLGEEQPATNTGADFQWIMDPIDGTEDLVYRIPTFGTILGLHYRGDPVVGIVDIPGLDACVSAAHGLGAFHNGERVHLADLPGDTPAASVRLMLSARANFIRHADHGPLFDTLTRMYPNHRIYRTCYAHLCAVTGAADAMIDYGNRIWDLAASRLLAEEAGGKYVTVQDIEVPGVGRVYGAVFGKPALVDKLVPLLGAT
jgi:fructose-1,6-bisphosphatase/inositol monophosphatase family enzyme